MLVDILFVVAIVVIVAIIMPKPNEAEVKAMSADKNCPPHKWEYHEILDQRGISQGQKMVCAVCKGTPGSIAGREE